MERNELASWLRLALTPGIGNGQRANCWRPFGLPATLFRQPLSALLQVVTPGTG